MKALAKKKSFSTGKGNNVVSVSQELMDKLRDYKSKTGISITHFVNQTLSNKLQKIEAGQSE